MKLGCVVMASGLSRRFGEENKLLAPFLGRPLLLHTLEQLPREGLDRIVVVTRWPRVAQLCEPLNLPCQVHQLPDLSDTIRLGLAHMGEMDGCLFLVGDQPLCSRESLLRLTGAFLSRPDTPARLAFQGRPGNPVLFPRSLFPALAALKGDRGGGSILPPAVTLVEALHPDELADADSPQELARLAASSLAGKLHSSDPSPLCNQNNF